MPGAGYDISASYSRSTSVGSRAGEGDFAVYGTNRQPPWLTIVLVVVGAFLVWQWFKNR